MSRSAFDAYHYTRFIRPDAARWVKPVHPDERKFDPNQPRDERGRWTDGDTSSSIESSLNNTSVDEIEAVAESLRQAGTPADYRQCVNCAIHYSKDFLRPAVTRIIGIFKSVSMLASSDICEFSIWMLK